MANVRISDLTAAAAVAGANEFEINEAGTSKKVTGTQILNFVHANTVADDVAALEAADIGVTVQGYDVDTAKTDVVQTFTAAQRLSVVTLSDGATVTPNFAAGNNFILTIAGNRSLANPSNVVAGQSGTIIVVQDGTGGRTLSFGSSYKFEFGVTPSLSPDAGAIDRLDYYVKSGTEILVSPSYSYS